MAELKGKKGGKKPNKKQDQDQVQEFGGLGPVDGESPEQYSNEKMKKKQFSKKKGGGKVSDPVTKGKISDDKDSRSSQSIDSEKDGRVVKWNIYKRKILSFLLYRL